MWAYLIRRLLLAASVVLAVSFASFVAFGLTLDPTSSLLESPSPEAHRIRHLLQLKYHLTAPIVDRYWIWLKGLFSHGFGTTVMSAGGYGPNSRLEGTPIGPALWSAVGVTAQLLAVSLVLIVAVSLLVGSLQANRPGSALDIGSRVLAYGASSVPAFLVAVLLRRWLVVYGSWFELGSPTGGFVDWWRHMALPVLALAVGFIGLYSRYIRTTMLDSLGQPYAVVARAKGLSERRVITRHALRNSLIPFTAALALDLAAVVGATVAVDYIFKLGGLASVFLDSLGEADPFELTAIVVVLAVLVSAFALISDLVISRLDPRVRIAGSLTAPD
jgi:peptide/nickel transport system permease protein